MRKNLALCMVSFTLIQMWVAIASTSGQEWSQFRGGSLQSSFTAGKPVTDLAEKNQRWSIDLPQGHSSPVISGNRIYLTSADRDASTVSTHCFDIKTGKQLWKTAESVAEWENIHPFNSFATPTCCADEDGVVSYFGSYGLIRYSSNGRKLWEHRIPVATVQYGVSTSPVSDGQRIYLLKDSKEGSFLKCYALSTGKEVWSVDRPLNSANNSTPLIMRLNDGSLMIAVNGTPVSQIYNAETGDLIAWNSGYPFEPISVPIYVDNSFIFSNRGTGSEGDPLTLPDFDSLRRKFPTEDDLEIDLSQIPRSDQLMLRPEVERGAPGRTIRLAFILGAFCDRNKNGRVDANEYRVATEEFASNRNKMARLALGKKGQYTDQDLTWTATRGVPEMSNPLVCDDQVFTIEDGGIYNFISLQGGQTIKKGRLQSRGRYTSSPVLWQDLLYLISNAGDWTIARITKDELDVISQGSFTDPVFATPAPTAEGLLIRTETTLRLYR